MYEDQPYIDCKSLFQMTNVGLSNCILFAISTCKMLRFSGDSVSQALLSDIMTTPISRKYIWLIGPNTINWWYHIKQKRNCFAGLMGTGYDSSWSEQEGLYFSAVGRSFYEQCFPRNSIHIGFSSYAAHYLSTRFEHSWPLVNRLVKLSCLP